MKTDLAGPALTLVLSAVLGVVAHGGPAQKADSTQGMGLTGQQIYLSAPDPKHPAQTLWKAWLKSGGYANSAFSGQDITALLFNAGKPEAKMTAPQGKGNMDTNVMFASGGVTYTSLLPAQRGTFGATHMTAQTVKWNSATKLGVARGNVHYRNGTSGMTFDYPVLYFDSGLRAFNTKPLSKGQ